MALRAKSLPSRARQDVADIPSEGQRPVRRVRSWFGAAGSTRVRILASFVVLLALSAVISVVAIRQVLLIRLDDRVRDAGQQEMLELDRLLAVGRDPETGEPFTSPEALFDAYLARNVPSNEEGLLAFVDGQFYRSAMARFPTDHIPPGPFADWEDISSSQPDEVQGVTGTYETELGTAYYRVRRVVLEGSTGAMVVTILPAAERAELNDLLTYGAAATLLVLVIASGLAWLIAGRVLSPVRLLTETAKSISQSDLTGRIEVRGTHEAAEMARSFNAMLDRLESVFRSQREFVSDASHELRDPLTICSGHLELLPEEPEERKRTIGLVIDELDRMGRIVDDLQLLADTEQPDFVNPEPVDLGTFTHELIGKVSAMATRQWTLDASADGTVTADRHRLTEAVLNLVHNAVQHTTEEDTIALGSSLDDELKLWVRDTGSGIPVAEQARIFRRFQRGRFARKRYRGSGLGLAIVKAIAEAHEGRVELESRPGEGSKFTLVLPRAPMQGVPREPDSDR